MVDLRRRASSSLAVILSLAVPSVSAAQHADVRALLREGFTARRAQRDADALRAFESALEIDRSPSTLAQVALAEHALGRWPDAERHLVECLAARDVWITRNESALRASLAGVRAHLGSLVLDGAPDGATVLLDGRPIASFPLQAPLRVTVGSVILRVTAAGHHPLERPLTITAGETLRESVRLAPETPPSPPPAVAAAPAPPTAPPATPPATPLVAPAVSLVRPRADATVGTRSWAPWVLVGGGALSLGAAVALSLLRGVAVDDLRRRCGATDLPATDAVECLPDAEARDAHDRASLYRDGSFVALGVGSAAVIAGVVWAIASPTSRRDARVGVGPRGATLSWSF